MLFRSVEGSEVEKDLIVELSACFEVGLLVVLSLGGFCVGGAGVGRWSYWEGGGEEVVWCEEAFGDALEGLFFDGE